MDSTTYEILKHKSFPPYHVVLKSAEDACNKLIESKEKQWFIRLLDILKNGNVARIVYNAVRYCDKKIFPIYIDVVAISSTFSYASFFDIYHHKNAIDFSTFPYPVEKEYYPITKINDIAFMSFDK